MNAPSISWQVVVLVCATLAFLAVIALRSPDLFQTAITAVLGICAWLARSPLTPTAPSLTTPAAPAPEAKP